MMRGIGRRLDYRLLFLVLLAKVCSLSQAESNSNANSDIRRTR